MITPEVSPDEYIGVISEFSNTTEETILVFTRSSANKA